MGQNKSQRLCCRLSESMVRALLLCALTLLVCDLDLCSSQNRTTVKDGIQPRSRTPPRPIRPVFQLSSTGGPGGGPIVSVNPIFNTRLYPPNFLGDPDATLTPLEMARKYGYRGENHLVVTQDGYILTLFHMFPNTSPDKFRGSVFLQHGMFTSASEWFINSKENLLCFQLADAGYDVWIGSARGTSYSRGHVNLSNTESAYWKFSANEMGKYDLPAEIDFALAKTGHEKISYIGLSLGTTQFWVMMSHHPHMNEKVKVMIAFSPVVYMEHIPGINRLWRHADAIQPLKDLVELIVYPGEFAPWGLTPLINFALPPLAPLCVLFPPMKALCQLGTHWTAGYSKHMSVKGLLVGAGHIPGSCSMRTMLHLLQFFRPSYFSEYDYGSPAKNKKVYGKKTPPRYDLKKTTVPCHIFYGRTDFLVSPIDAEQVGKDLSNATLHPVDNFSHFDFHIAENTTVLVNQPVLKILEQY